MQSSKRYVSFVFSFSVLYCILFKINDVYSQVGEKSRNYCAAQAPAVLDATYLPAIIGSARASEDEYPHMAALGYGSKSNRTWGCGASLISKDFVLTAANCLSTENDGEVKVVRLGTKNIRDPSPGYKDCEISEKISHPEYLPPVQYNDIGLLRLKIDVTFTSKIKPACLQVDTNFDAATMSVTGWGKQGSQQPKSSYLLKVDLVMYNLTFCEKYNSRKETEYPNGVRNELMFCAGGSWYELGGICSGDFGGPLQILIKQQYYVVGVASATSRCDRKFETGVYTRVSNYVPWIEGIVWK